MNSQWFVKIAAIMCAICLAFGVMSQAVFARADSDGEDGYTAEQPEETFVVLGGVSPTPAATDNRLSVPLYVEGRQAGQCAVINGEPYVGVAAFCDALGLNAQIMENGMGVSLAADGLLLLAQTDRNYLMCNERYLYLTNGVRVLNGKTALPVEQLVRCMGLTAYWDRVQWTISVDDVQLKPLAPGAGYYNETDVYWLSRLISSMAADKPMDAKIAVGNVCVNRLGNERFAGQDNIYEVVFAKNQFEAVTTGIIYMEPSEDSVIAAKLALEGYDVVGGADYVAKGDLGPGYSFVAELGELRFYSAA